MSLGELAGLAGAPDWRGREHRGYLTKGGGRGQASSAPYNSESRDKVIGDTPAMGQGVPTASQDPGWASLAHPSDPAPACSLFRKGCLSLRKEGNCTPETAGRKQQRAQQGHRNPGKCSHG